MSESKGQMKRTRCEDSDDFDMLDSEAPRQKKCRIDVTITDDSSGGTNAQAVDLESKQLFDSIENNMKAILEQWETEKAAFIAEIEDLKQTNAALKDEIRARECTIYARDVYIRELEKELIEDTLDAGKARAEQAQKDCDDLREKLNQASFHSS